MGAARTAEAHVPRGPSRREDGQGLLRIRRDREEEVVVDSEADVRTDTAKAAVWAAIAGLAQIAAALTTGSSPWYVLFVAVGFGLILPAIAILHVRHAAVRASGAVLGTIGGIAVVTIGIAASANTQIIAAALFVRGIWWWTIGKMWWETALLPRALGVVTMALAAIALGVALVSPAIAIGGAWTTLGLLLGLWLLAVAASLWRITRASA